MKQKTIISLIISICLIPLWGLGLLAVSIASIFTATVTFIITLSLFQFTPISKDQDSKKFLLLFPLFYLVSSLVYLDIRLLWNFPIVWIFILSVLTIMNNTKTLAPYFTFILISVFYCTLLYPHEHLDSSRDLSLSTSQKTISNNLNINSFKIINALSDTICLELNDKPILIETWNETCKPCLKAIKELSYHSLGDINHVYLYQSRTKNTMSTDSIFNFSLIEHKDQIYLDPENTLYNILNLRAFPSFILVSPEGKIKHVVTGFQNEESPTTIEQLKALLNSID